jgi:hypothetical protein
MSRPLLPPCLRESLFAALAYVLTTWVCVWLLKHPLLDAAAWLRAAVGLLPVLAIGWAIRVVVRRALAADELQRRINLEAIAAAALVVGLGTLTLSLLVAADVIAVSGQAALVWTLPALAVGYVAARFWAMRRYR